MLANCSDRDSFGGELVRTFPLVDLVALAAVELVLLGDDRVGGGAAAWAAVDLVLRPLVVMPGISAMGIGMAATLYEPKGVDVRKRLVWLWGDWCCCCVAMAAAAEVEN
jgi:hypothetical protein